MTFTFDELKSLRDEGYTDDQIASVLAEDDSSIGDVFKEGFTLEQITSTISGQPIPEGFATQPAEPAPEATLAEGAEDIGRKFLMGGAGGIRAFTDLLGADNPVSQSIAGIEDYIAEGLSAESKQDSQAISRLFQEVESKGLTDKFLAGLEAFKMAPAETLAQTAGYMIPNLAAGLAGKAAQLTRGGMMALQAGVGAAQGMGTAKGEIYQGSYDYLINQGVPEDEARSKATEAQATFGENLPQIFLSAGLGAAAASTGAERIITRMLTRTGKEVSERSIKDVIKGGLKGIAGEVPIETLQEGQEKVATNIALQNLGADVDTFAGVPQAVGMAVGPAAILGGVAGAVEVLTPEQQAERKIEKQSTQMARQLTVSPTDTTSKVIVDEITKKENAIDNLRSALSSINPNTPEGQELSTAIKKVETELSTLKKQSGETVETEQARLAREIAAPVEPAPTAEAPTVTTAPVSETITEAPVVSEERAQVSETTPAPTISEKPPTSTMIGAEPTQPAPAEGVAEPSRSVAIAPKTAAEPAAVPEREGPVGNRIKLGRSPQTYVVEETIPQTEREMELGEQFFRVRNERTGETQVVEQADMKPVQPREEKRFNPLGYDIVDVVEDINAGNTATPIRAVNQVIKESTDLRNRVKAASERRQQPRKRGKAAILERIARDRSAGTLTEQTARALTDFVNRIRDDAIGDVAISIRQKGVSNYDFADNLVSFFLNQDKKDLGTAVGIHEFWHGLSRYLPEAEVQQMNDQYLKEMEAYIKKNPWFLAFVGRYSLTPEQFEAYKQFNPKEAETKLEPVRDEQGNIVRYKIKFDKDNYRYIMLDEFIAEKMTDLVIGKQAIPDTFLGKLAKVFREFLDLIKARLGRNPYEKFYQLVTSTEDKLILQRTSGVAEPFQIYDPQTYDYSTQRRMAVEPREEGPVQESPEGQSVPVALGNGIDIGPEDNMPINRKIDSHLKNFLFLRGFFESAVDRLRRNGFTKLGNAVADYFEGARRRLETANKILLPSFQEYSSQRKKDRDQIEKDVQEFFAAQENGRDTEEVRAKMNPVAIKIVDAWQKFGEVSGTENQNIGVKVYDQGKKAWRKIGKIAKFWPRQLKPEYQRALKDNVKYAKEYNEIVQALLDEKKIDKPEDAEKYLRPYRPEAYENDYFSGIEKARGAALPESLYDYSMQVMTDYVSRWAQHVSRIEQFGQKTTQESKTLWDREMDKVTDQRTRDYIESVRERVVNYFPNDPYIKGMSAMNIWATGLQLGNPASAILNFIGGSTLNAMIGQPGSLGSFIKSLGEMTTDLKRQMLDAQLLAVTSRDLMNIVGDHQVIIDESKVAKAGQKVTDFLLKWSGFTPVEQMVRTQSYIIGKSFLNSVIEAYANNPNSSYARRSAFWLSRNNFDLDKLLVEQGSGPETSRLLRYFANISQGSYTIDQVPVFIDNPIGKFLFKYQKFSTQVMRMAWKNTFEPLFKAMTGKGETMQLPDATRQALYRATLTLRRELGDERRIDISQIPTTVTKGQGRALALIPAMMWLSSAYVGGEVLLRLRDILFGVLMKGPEYEDMLKELEDDDKAAALYLASERAWYNLIGIGALGLIGNYAQFFFDWQDRERVKNPLDPPALGVLKETATFIQNLYDQKTITAGDIDNFTKSTLSAYRTTQKLGQTIAGWTGREDIPGVKEEMFRREVANINKYSRRWAEEAGIEFRMRRPTEVTPSERTPINRKIAGYLQRGEPQMAAVFAKEYLKGLPKADRLNAIQSISTGARNRQPLRLGSGPMDEVERKAFLRWLKDKVSEERYARIAEMDKQYQRDYKKFLRMLPNR